MNRLTPFIQRSISSFDNSQTGFHFKTRKTLAQLSHHLPLSSAHLNLPAVLKFSDDAFTRKQIKTQYNYFVENYISSFLENGSAPSIDIDSFKASIKHLSSSKALEEIHSRLITAPNHFELLCLKGRYLARLRKYRKAEETYRKAISISPDHPDGFNGLAHCFAWQGQYSEAEQLYLSTIAAFPDHSDAYNGLARCLAWHGNLSEAQQKYRDTITRFPDHSYAYLGLARILTWQKKYSEAVQIHLITIAIFNENQNAQIDAQNGLAKCLAKQKRFPEAEQRYRSTIASYPDNADSYNGLALCFEMQNKFPEAEQQYQSNILMFPDNLVAYNGLGHCFEVQNKFPEAEQQYRSNKAMFPDHPTAYYSLAHCFEMQRRYQEAEQQYRSNIEIFPDHPVAFNGLAKSLEKQEKYAEAIIIYRRMRDRFPSSFAASQRGLSDCIRKQRQHLERQQDFLLGTHNITGAILRANSALEKGMAPKEARAIILEDLIKGDISQFSLKELRTGLRNLPLSPKDRDELSVELDDLITYFEDIEIEKVKEYVSDLILRWYEAVKLNKTEAPPAQKASRDVSKELERSKEPVQKQAVDPKPIEPPPNAEEILESILDLLKNPRKRNFVPILRELLGKLILLRYKEISGVINKSQVQSILAFLAGPPQELKREFKSIDKTLLEKAKGILIDALRT